MESGNYKHVKYLKRVLFLYIVWMWIQLSKTNIEFIVYFIVYFHNAYSGTPLKGNNQQTFTDKLLETVKPHLKICQKKVYNTKISGKGTSTICKVQIDFVIGSKQSKSTKCAVVKTKTIGKYLHLGNGNCGL